MTVEQSRTRLAEVGLMREFAIGWRVVEFDIGDLTGLDSTDLPRGVAASVETTLPHDRVWSNFQVYFDRMDADQLTARIVRTLEAGRDPDADCVMEFFQKTRAAIEGHAQASDFERGEDLFGQLSFISYRLRLTSRRLDDGFREVLEFEERMHRAILLALGSDNVDVL